MPAIISFKDTISQHLLAEHWVRIQKTISGTSMACPHVADCDAVRRTLVRMLQRLGHECVPTCRGEDAIAAFDQARSDGAPFGAVLLDLTIVGGLGGLKTTKQRRLLDPEV